MDSSTAPENHDSSVLTSLRRIFVETILDPLFDVSNIAVGPYSQENLQLSPILRAHRFDDALYPFIYEGILEYVPDHFTINVLPVILQETRPIDILNALQDCWDYYYYVARRLREVLQPLEVVYRQRVVDFRFVSVQPFVIYEFRARVFDKLAAIVLACGFNCISRDGIITHHDALSRVQVLIGDISSETDLPTILVWDDPLTNRLLHNIRSNSGFWTRLSLKSFLRKISLRLKEWPSMFLDYCSQLEAKRKFLMEMSGFRNKLLFDNNASNFRNLLENEASNTELKQLFILFSYDRDFLQVMSLHAKKCFKEILVGCDSESAKEPLVSKSFLTGFLTTWKRMYAILRSIKSKDAFRMSILTPLTHLLDHSSTRISDVQIFLAQHCHSLLSTKDNVSQILATCKRKEVFEIVSLACFMRSTEVFVDFHRFLLSKRLLGCISVSSKLEDEVVKVLSKHEPYLAHGIRSVLSEARDWAFYQTEISSYICDESSDILLEPRIVKRSNWALEEDVGLVLHRHCQSVSDHMTRYFERHHPNRSLSIHSTAGETIIRTKLWDFKGDSLRLTLTTGQLSLLSLFESSKKISVRQVYGLLLKNDTEYGREFVLNLIQSMTGTFQLLTREPCGQIFRETDIIRLNDGFQPNERHITLPVPLIPNKREEKPEAPVSVEENVTKFWKEYVESVIVKVAKEKLKIDLDQLKQEVRSKVAAKLTLDDKGFDKTLQSLEERDFLFIDGSTITYVL